MYVFTICSNNYLAQAIVLGNSIKVHNPDYEFKIFLCDEKSDEIDYTQIPHNIIEIKTIEPEIDNLAKKYNIIELNTAVKPTVFQHLFREGAQKVVYLDPDICVFNSLKILDEELNTNSILLTPHIVSPIPFDEKTPNENLFLNFGIYNLGFLGLRNDENSKKLLAWWKTHTYTRGYIMPSNGIFVDQLPINHAPIFFDRVKILKHPGLNMAPWNLHERTFLLDKENFKVNSSHDLIFFHFSSHKTNSVELPLHYYNRYNLKERPDLRQIITDYDRNLTINNISKYSNVRCMYSAIYELENKRIASLKWDKTHPVKKVLINIKKLVPTKLKNLLR